MKILRIPKLNKDEIMQIIHEGHMLLNNNPEGKVGFHTGDSTWFKYMPFIGENIIFTKYVTKEKGGMHAAYIISSRKSGEIIDMFKSDDLNTCRAAAVAAYTTWKFSNNTKTISFIGFEGRIGSKTREYLQDFCKDKNVIKVGPNSSKEELKNALRSDVVISTVNYIEKPWADKNDISHNQLVIPVHTRGWHNRVDDAFENVFTDYLPQVKDWIRSDAIEVRNYNGSKPKNAIVYNFGHVVFDYCLWKYVVNKK